MKKITFIDPGTFEQKVFEFDDFHYAIAEEIQKAFSEKTCDDYLNVLYVTPIISNVDGDKLNIGVTKDRKIGETAERYRITIEKVKP